jgi:hypothetical protein
MSEKPTYLKRPGRVVWLTFLCLSAIFTISLPFMDGLSPKTWPFAFAYCALLPAFAVGAARLGRRVALVLVALTMICILPSVIGVALAMRQGADIEGGTTWLHITIYLLYVLGVVALVLAGRGWLLYWRESHEVG